MKKTSSIKTPLADSMAFSTGNAYIVLHKDAQKIERQLRRANVLLGEAHSHVRNIPLADAIAVHLKNSDPFN